MSVWFVFSCLLNEHIFFKFAISSGQIIDFSSKDKSFTFQHLFNMFQYTYNQLTSLVVIARKLFLLFLIQISQQISLLLKDCYSNITSCMCVCFFICLCKSDMTSIPEIVHVFTFLFHFFHKLQVFFFIIFKHQSKPLLAVC